MIRSVVIVLMVLVSAAALAQDDAAEAIFPDSEWSASTPPSAPAEPESEVMGRLQAVVELLGRLGYDVDEPGLADDAVLALVRSADPRAEIVTNRSTEARTITNSVLYAGNPRDEVAYICTGDFGTGSGWEIASHVWGLAEKRPAGLILDLRGSQGSDLESLEILGGLFLEAKSPLLKIVDPAGKTVSEHRARKIKRVSVPIVLLVDSKTGGSAEAFASILSGKPRVLVMGQTTSGYARIQKPVTVLTDLVVNIGVTKILPMSGVDYDGVGIKPDIPVEKTDALSCALSEIEAAIKDDPLALRAMNVLIGLQALGISDEK